MKHTHYPKREALGQRDIISSIKYLEAKTFNCNDSDCSKTKYEVKNTNAESYEKAIQKSGEYQMTI